MFTYHIRSITEAVPVQYVVAYTHDAADEHLLFEILHPSEINSSYFISLAISTFIPKLSINKDGSISKRNASYIEKEGFTEIFNLIERLMKRTGEELLAGNISVLPTDGRESPACKYCDFKAVCGIEDAKIKQVPDLNNAEVIDIIRRGEEDGIYTD